MILSVARGEIRKDTCKIKEKNQIISGNKKINQKKYLHQHQFNTAAVSL